MTHEAALALVRELCGRFPEVSERPSHGAPTFFVRGKRAFLTLHDDHHGDGRLAVWCAAPDGNQELLVSADPETYFRPPYVGHRGWLGVRLDRGIAPDELAGVVEDAYAEVAPPRLLAEAGLLDDELARAEHALDLVEPRALGGEQPLAEVEDEEQVRPAVGQRLEAPVALGEPLLLDVDLAPHREEGGEQALVVPEDVAGHELRDGLVLDAGEGGRLEDPARGARRDRAR